jgi:ABC-type transport system involved in multi-copper enzyme maturation permease subunit
MRQRLGIAQALLGSPRYVLLDEPMNGLDPEGSAEVRALLARLVREEGLSVLVSSHQLHELAALCNRIAILQRGRRLIEAETGSLLGALPGRFHLETDDDERAARVLAELGVHGAAAAPGAPGAPGGLVLQTGTRTAGDVARALVGAGLDVRRLGARETTLEEIYLRWARGEVHADDGAHAEHDADGGEDPRARPEPDARPPVAGSGLARVARYELARLGSRWRNPALLALPAVLAAADVFLAQGRVAADAKRVARGELASATATTGFGASAEALATGLPLLALVLAALASQMIAGELARGTLRNVLLRPQTRLAVAGGKALAGALVALAAHLALVTAAVGAAALAFGFGDLVEILPNGKPFPLVAAAELRGDFARALAVPAAPLLGYLLLGFACGAFARGASSALGLAVGAALALDLARSVARDLGFEGALLSAYLPSPLGDSSFLRAFADRARGVSNSVYELGGSIAGLPQDLVVPLAWALACFAVAAILLARRSVP